jgi:hypothetical protein
MGVLQLNSVGTAVINAVGLISATAGFIDLNGTAIPPTPITKISDKVEPLALLGAPKVPVDFGGDAVTGRKEEQVLVDTTLTPAGTYNPNTLKETVIDSVLSGLGIGSAVDIYDPKYVTPIERKTTLSTAGKARNYKLVVPPRDSSQKTPSGNLIPPERHFGGEFKYETEDDWNTAAGQKAANAMTSTSDYEYNHKLPGAPGASYTPTGGSGNTVAIPADKLADINSKTDFPASYALSEHFTLGMFVHSQGHYLRDTTLPSGKSGTGGGTFTKSMLVANLAALCVNIMEPIFKELGPCTQMGGGATWTITSGLRNENSGSDHNKGMACDFHLYPNRDIAELYALVTKLEKMLPYNQLIFEYRNNGASNWIHVSYSSSGRQGRAFTMIDDKVVNASGSVASGSTGLYQFFV